MMAVFVSFHLRVVSTHENHDHPSALTLSLEVPVRALSDKHCIALVFLFIAVSTGRPGHAVELSDKQLLPAMIATVVPLDVAIPVGLLPFPVTQLAAEATEFSANLALKAYRPLLNVPGPIFRLPNADGGCSYSFALPSAQANYENLFGIIPIRAPLYDAVNNRFLLWNERWGDLGRPARLYHANSSVKVSVASIAPARRWNPDTGSYRSFVDPISGKQTEYYYPILAQGGAQTVIFPVGTHDVSWQASTQLNVLTDIVLPGGLLAVGILTEVKNAAVGLKAAKKVKQSGIGDDVADQADNAADVAAALTAKEKFRVVWKQLITPEKKGKLSTLVKEALYKKITKIVIDLLCKLIDIGVNVWDQEAAQALLDGNQLTAREKTLLTALLRVEKLTFGTEVLVLKQLVLGQDKDEIAADVIKYLVAAVDTATGSTALEDLLTLDSATTFQNQKVYVYDTHPPRIVAGSAPLILEATDFGGARRYRAIDTMRSALVEVSDDCGRQPIVTSDAPELLPLGETVVTWTAQDAGPNPADGQDYAPTAQQTVIVQDTQPPLLLAPPSKVLESDSDISAEAAMIGDGVAVDLSDPQPTVTNDAPAAFETNSRHQVHWTATDGSGNQTQKSQWITVKTIGSNTPPAANDASAETLTGQPVDIRLTGQDLDFLDGRFDPLWFDIAARPQHGEFVAPLYPFFIDDYRTKPEDGLGDDYVPGQDVYAYIAHKYCENGLNPPLDFVFGALFVHVTDDGTHYVLDESFSCDLEHKADTRRRISKWDRDGNFLGQMRFGPGGEDWPMNDAFVLDRDGFLYYSTILEPGSSSAEMFLNRCRTDFIAGNGGIDAQASELCVAGWKFENSSDPNDRLDVRNLSYARVDSQQGIVFITDKSHVFAFRIVNNLSAGYLGELGPTQDGAVLDGWLGNGQGMEVDSQGNLYVADSGYQRIHKFGRSYFDQDGHFVMGDYVGWAGRCSGSGNKACDDDKHRSKGYSCTYAADSCVSEPGSQAGSLQGQFDTPLYLAIDPNDVLYVADYNNFRVQRFSPDGSFAGEAVSEGTGINKGDRPSFVLGNMDKPRSLSVNSSQFFVVDRDEQFVHIFGTLPFKDITDDAVTVTYVPNQDFHDDTDTFTFTVGDGLVHSLPATVRIQVSRNFRPPVALAANVSTREDTPRSITLSGDDPDGIVGKDFNGLDTLTFAVTREPAHGQLTGSEADWTYTPDQDFFGEDQIRFTVSDGFFTSEEAVVTIAVTSVNDPPVVTIDVDDTSGSGTAASDPVPQVGRRAARGFPMLLTSTYTDDPSNGYEAHLEWGDGTVDGTGEFVDGGGENPQIEGVAISPPPLSEMEGRTYAEHTYTTTGFKSVRLCVTDSDGAEGCDSTLISVENLVSLGVGTKVFADPQGEDEVLQTQIGDGLPFQYQLTVTNGVPSAGDGLVAGEVTLDGELPPELVIGGVETTKGNCTLDGNLVHCALGSLAPGEDVTLTANVSGPGDLLADTDMDFSGQVTTTSPALESTMSFFVSTTLLAKTTGLCAGDCNVDRMVTVDELVKAVNITLGILPLSECPASDSNGDVAVTVDELATAVAHALDGCS